MADDYTITISVDTAIGAAALLARDAQQEQRDAAASVQRVGFVSWRLAIDHLVTMRRLRELEVALGRRRR